MRWAYLFPTEIPGLLIVNAKELSDRMMNHDDGSMNGMDGGLDEMKKCVE